jgi:hypothetical protein
MNFRFLLIFAFVVFASSSKASDLVFKTRVATALNTVTLYPDSSYFEHSDIRFSEGDLFEILGETTLQHLDDAQNQKFKWYKVRSLSGQEGWIFGDGIAVMMEAANIDSKLKPFHKKKISLNNGFEKSVTWIAAIQGRDNLYDNDLLNSTYHEYYVVMTNEHGKSVHMNYESQSVMGREVLNLFQMKDMTNDGVADFLMETKSYSSSSNLENRTLEIFSLQSGYLKKILEERMTLTYDDDLFSPAMFKSVEVSSTSIRVEFVDYIACEKFSLPYKFDKNSETQERCMEFVTYTFAWDNRKKQFIQFYQENRNVLKGIVIRPKIFLKSEPSFLSEKIEQLAPNVPFIIIKHFEKVFIQNGEKKISPYLYVQSTNGNRGYIRGKVVRFLNTEHAEILHDFYQKTPLSKTKLKTEKVFLKIIGDGSESTSKLPLRNH